MMVWMAVPLALLPWCDRSQLVHTFLAKQSKRSANTWSERRVRTALHLPLASAPIDQTAVDVNDSIARQFKVLTCSASACAKKRKALAIEEFATFAAFWEKSNDRNSVIKVEETSCLGCCKNAPCVAVEHEDYEGTVALIGMDSTEFHDRVFQRVINDDDVNRVWSAVENAVQTMAEENEESTEV